MLKEYIDFYDVSIPIGKRKLQYIKYAMHNGTHPSAAFRQAKAMFGDKEYGYKEPTKPAEPTEQHYCTASLTDICSICGEYDYI